ncbi:MAG: S-layer homology domain-containing protein [Eubacteriales bacterium]|nr:S-layer homology domain-containing protein [Eubacteriales bacterium]
MRKTEHGSVWRGAATAVLSAAMVMTFIPAASFAADKPADTQSSGTVSTAAAAAVPNYKDVNLGVGDTDNTRYVTWESNSGADESVRFIEASKLVTDASGNKTFPESGANVVRAEKYADSTGKNRDGSASVYGTDGYSNYHARVKNYFKDNTEYAYQIGGADGNWSQIYYTTTQKNTGDRKFSFVFAGDPQIGASGNSGKDTEGWQTTMDKVDSWFGKDVEFLLSAGDQINNYNPDEKEYEGYFATKTMTSLPMAVNVGNHDNGNMLINAYSDHYTVPENVDSTTATVGSQSGDYWYEYDGALIISLNSNSMSTAAHKAYMEKAIQDFTAQYGAPTWKIVTFHHSVYSTASHTQDSDILQRREQLPPVFSELGIDVVLMGHDHVYTRSYMMQGTTPVTDASKYDKAGDDQYGAITNPDRGEVLYVTANSASGSKFYKIKELDFPFRAKMNQEQVPNITKVDVSSGSLTVTTYRTGESNTVNDVVDTFTINRNNSEAPARHNINVASAQNGSVSANLETANRGTTVTVTLKPDSGYKTDKVTVKDASGNDVAVSGSGSRYTFVMPDSEVTVSASFKTAQSPAAPETALPFGDVHKSDWFYNAVKKSFENKVMNGTGADRFEPSAALSRGMFISILYNLEGRPAADKSAGFGDVSSDKYYASAVNWAAANKVVSGTGDNKFSPEQSITREQMASMLYRYAQYKNTAGSSAADLSIFTDGSSVSTWAQDAMSWAVAGRIISGTGNNMLNPQGTATRAEAAQIVSNYSK